MRDIDLFDFFRYALGTVVTVYAVVVTFQSLYGWYVYLTSGDKYVPLIRRYLLVHGLRVRVKSFWGDVLVCILLSVAFLIICHAHTLIYRLGDSVAAARSHGNQITRTH